ncbi:MAG: lytic transglycosylase domain-containing protein [Flavobacterium sp.]|nr:lytic transglycosylase domain-containing protein [Flavobacterium sp.]
MKFYSRPTLIFVILLSASLLIFAGKALLSHKGTSQYFPAAVDFSDEPTPLNIIDVKERFDRELLVNANLHSSTLLILKRANRYFPVIEPILKQNNIPDDFKYLCVIESALTNATSAAGAKGFWQFMPETAKEKGMEINESVDERYHLTKATQAACDYLLNAKDKFSNWTLAAASYNCGMNGISKSLETQKVSNYYDLLLTDETQRYIFRILALKTIMQNPKLYGFNLEQNELYQPIATKIIEIDSTISDLAQFSIEQGINYKLLKIYNPWLRDKKLINLTNKKYLLEIPITDY